jgi:hypothetical protein
MNTFYEKYLKYKSKYLALKKLRGGDYEDNEIIRYDEKKNNISNLYKVRKHGDNYYLVDNASVTIIKKEDLDPLWIEGKIFRRIDKDYIPNVSKKLKTMFNENEKILKELNIDELIAKYEADTAAAEARAAAAEAKAAEAKALAAKAEAEAATAAEAAAAAAAEAAPAAAISSSGLAAEILAGLHAQPIVIISNKTKEIDTKLNEKFYDIRKKTATDLVKSDKKHFGYDEDEDEKDIIRKIQELPNELNDREIRDNKILFKEYYRSLEFTDGFVPNKIYLRWFDLPEDYNNGSLTGFPCEQNSWKIRSTSFWIQLFKYLYKSNKDEGFHEKLRQSNADVNLFMKIFDITFIQLTYLIINNYRDCTFVFDRPNIQYPAEPCRRSVPGYDPIGILRTKLLTIKYKNKKNELQKKWTNTRRENVPIYDIGLPNININRETDDHRVFQIRNEPENYIENKQKIIDFDMQEEITPIHLELKINLDISFDRNPSQEITFLETNDNTKHDRYKFTIHGFNNKAGKPQGFSSFYPLNDKGNRVHCQFKLNNNKIEIIKWNIGSNRPLKKLPDIYVDDRRLTNFLTSIEHELNTVRKLMIHLITLL